jgi:hypothetical protein
MDQLDLALQTAGPLLRRVDEVISTVGAAPDHRIWAELRRVRLLPGDAVRAVAALRPAELAEAAPELRADARAYASIAQSLPGADGWSGAAADSYESARRRTAGFLSGGTESLDERLEATADLAEALIDWMSQTRNGLATVLAQALGSTEALQLANDAPLDPAANRTTAAAADVGATLLQAVANSYNLATDLLEGSAHLTTVLHERS